MYRDDLWEPDLPKTKIDAIMSGSLYYYDGVPCDEGHVVRRYCNGTCEVCVAYHEWKRGHSGLTSGLWEHLCRHNCQSRRYFNIPYSLQTPYRRSDAVAHFEKLLLPDMTWMNYGIIWRIGRVVKLSKSETYEQAIALENFIPIYIDHDRKVKVRRGLHNKHPLRLRPDPVII